MAIEHWLGKIDPNGISCYIHLILKFHDLTVAFMLTPTMKDEFFCRDFLSKCDQIWGKLRIWSHLLKKSLIENFLFCTVSPHAFTPSSSSPLHPVSEVYIQFKIKSETKDAWFDSGTLILLKRTLKKNTHSYQEHSFWKCCCFTCFKLMHED